MILREVLLLIVLACKSIDETEYFLVLEKEGSQCSAGGKNVPGCQAADELEPGQPGGPGAGARDEEGSVEGDGDCGGDTVQRHQNVFKSGHLSGSGGHLCKYFYSFRQQSRAMLEPLLCLKCDLYSPHTPFRYVAFALGWEFP